MLRSILALGAIALAMHQAGLPAHAHFTMLLPETAGAKKGDRVAFIYQWGHPFEHQLFDAPPPARVQVVGPDGTRQDLTNTLEKIKEDKATAHRFRFRPQERGDYLFLLTTPPIWMAEEQEYYQDTAMVVLHVQAQKGWDVGSDRNFKMLPLTRPYGLLPGMVFQARVVGLPAPARGAEPDVRLTPQAGLPVFCERYNPRPPKELPPDELITFTSKTDPNGTLTCTLPTAGWWGITVQRDAGRRTHMGRDYPLRQRLTWWVYVNRGGH
jgi:cobalt/nickel transport protein